MTRDRKPYFTNDKMMELVRNARLRRVRRPRRLPDAPTIEHVSEEVLMEQWRDFRRNVVPNMMTSAELERVRQIQEAAWFKAGYSRTEILMMFWNWPVSLGFHPYEWTVGQPDARGR